MGGVKKCGEGVRKCVADVVEGVEKWRGGKVFWVWEKVKRGVRKCDGVWGSNGGEV